MASNETQMVILVDNLDEKKRTKSAYVAQVIDLYKTEAICYWKRL